MSVLDMYYLKNNPKGYLSSKPRMSTLLAESIINGHSHMLQSDDVSYQDFAEKNPDACHCSDYMIWIDTLTLMQYLGYKV